MPSLVPHPSPLKHAFIYNCSDSRPEPCKPSPQPSPLLILVLGSWAAGRRAGGFAEILQIPNILRVVSGIKKKKNYVDTAVKN